MLECRDIDDLMMDWLYQELDQEQLDRVEAHLDQCARCSSELSALKQTRAAFRELPDEEPPAALSAKLLHEAAQRAPSARERARTALGEERPGWLAQLAGLFRPLILHPAFTAAATLVLVAGVVGTLYVKQDGHQVASPTLDRSKAAEADETSPASRPAAEEETRPVETESAEAERADDLKPRLAAGDDEAADRGYKADLLDRERRQKLEERRVAKDQDGVSGKKALPKAPPPAVRETSEPNASFRSKSRHRVSGTRQRKKGATTLKAQATTTNAVTGADPLIGGGGGRSSALGGVVGSSDDRDAFAPAHGQAAREGGEAQQAYRANNLAWAKQQTQRLSRAVADKSCRKAAEIANDILDRYPEYYTRRVKNSKPVQKCRWYVQRERSRRVAVRRKARAARKAAAARKAGGKPAKAKAAPARDEAAAESAE